ncbi:MAG: hypothetical protein CVT67_06095 [Actinobacteria bacterium HGW-Actinobacteria-7]|nr:MAG: hypothetical protein CVT67_06095 [Actinobacteria bacterium HGW-Actinobacteria-7]
MRRLVVAFVVAGLAFSLVGCGGGGDAPAAETPAVVPDAFAPSGAPAEPVPDYSAEETATFELFPMGEDVPKTVSDRLAEKQPMALLFVDSAQKDSDDLTAEVKAVVEENKGLIDLLVYDVGKYSGVDKDGRITIDEQQLNEDPKAQESVVLARALGVNFSPYVIIVDDQGYIIYRHSGYVDSGLLERQVQRVTE